MGIERKFLPVLGTASQSTDDTMARCYFPIINWACFALIGVQKFMKQLLGPLFFGVFFAVNVCRQIKKSNTIG